MSVVNLWSCMSSERKEAIVNGIIAVAIPWM